MFDPYPTQMEMKVYDFVCLFRRWKGCSPSGQDIARGLEIGKVWDPSTMQYHCAQLGKKGWLVKKGAGGGWVPTKEARAIGWLSELVLVARRASGAATLPTDPRRSDPLAARIVAEIDQEEEPPLIPRQVPFPG